MYCSPSQGAAQRACTRNASVTAHPTALRSPVPAASLPALNSRQQCGIHRHLKPWLTQQHRASQAGQARALPSSSSQPDVTTPGASPAASLPALVASCTFQHSAFHTGTSIRSSQAVAAGPSAPGPTGSCDVVVPIENGFPHRWKVVAMMATSFVLCNMDKVNMSVAVIPMAAELGWSATDRGLVSSSFFWGYSLTQLPAGWIATKIGGTKVLLAGVLLWSLGTLIAPPAAKAGLLALCATRVLVGLGEGFAPSAATAVLAKIVPSTERARAVTAVWGGLDVGSAVGLMLCGPLIAAYGWPSVFYLFALLGLLWCIFWPVIRPNKQEEDLKAATKAAADAADALAAQEAGTALQSMDYIGPVTASAATYKLPREIPPDSKVPWSKFFASQAVWAVTVAHFCFNWGYYTLLAWLPSYFELALGLNVEKSSFLTLIPYIAMTVMTPFVGPIADGWVKKGVSLTQVRKICQGIAFVGPAICMIGCALLTPSSAITAKGAAAAAAAGGAPAATPFLVALLSVSFALGAWSRAGLYCNHQDLSPKYASALLGITNTAGALPGVLGVTAAGYMLDATNSWALALFYPTALCQVFGAIIYSIYASSQRQSW